MFIEINPAHNREGQTIQTPRQSHRPEPMPAGAYLKFRNDRGVREICIGVALLHGSVIWRRGVEGIGGWARS